MDDLERIALFGSTPSWVTDADLSTGASAGRKLAASSYLRSVKIAVDLDEKRAEIESDGELSDDGKRKRLSRVVRDAAVSLNKVAGHRDKLAGELADARESARPRVAANDAVSAAIWSKLPEDATSVAMLYGDALAASDWHTCNAIENLPVVFPGRIIDADTLAGLRRERSAVETPDAAKAVETAEDNLAVVEGSHRAAMSHLGDIGRGLPDPDAEDGVEAGTDGLRQFSPSAFAEAMGESGG